MIVKSSDGGGDWGEGVISKNISHPGHLIKQLSSGIAVIIIVTTPTTTQPQHSSWVGHENDFAYHPPPPPPPQKLNVNNISVITDPILMKL